jgi:hypothetical protein
MKENFSIDNNPHLQKRLKREFNKISSKFTEKDSNESIVNKFNNAGLSITYQSDGKITTVAQKDSYDRWEKAIYLTNELSLGVTVHKAHKEFQYEKKVKREEARALAEQRYMIEKNRKANLPPKKPGWLEKATTFIFNLIFVRIFKMDNDNHHETLFLKFVIKSTLVYFLIVLAFQIFIFSLALHEYLQI